MADGSTSTYRLIVEGKDDQHIISNLLTEHKIDNWRLQYNQKENVGDGTIEIIFEKGAGPLLNNLPAQLQRPNQQRVGVVLDVDSDDDDFPGGIESRWDQIRNAAEKTGELTSFPDAPRPDGTEFVIRQRERDLHVGVWLMPDNESAGAIEDFVLGLIPEDDTLLPKVKDCLGAVPEGERPFSKTDHTKAVVRTWLAWQEEPGKPMGGAVSAKFLDAESDLATRFVAWIRRLYDVE